MPEVTFTNCTGTSMADMLSRAPPRAPLFSYTQHTYTGITVPTDAYFNLVGRLVKASYNVTTPYTGPKSSLSVEIFRYGLPTPGVRYDPSVNLKTAGDRVATPAAVTGAQNGDTGLAVANPEAWIPLGVPPMFSADVSGEPRSAWPTVTIAITTDQGIAAGSDRVHGGQQ
jgi:hypothetical protein